MLIAGIAQNVDLPVVWWFSFLFIYFSVHFFFQLRTMQLTLEKYETKWDVRKRGLEAQCVGSNGKREAN